MRCSVTGSYVCRCDKNNKSNEQKNISTKETLRKLFTDHVVYTKFYISSYFNNNPDSQPILNRLLDNQKEIGGYLIDFIDEVNSRKITGLLIEYINVVGNGLIALKTNTDVQKAIDAIFTNSKHVSEFISSINPVKLPVDVVKKHFNQHNQYVIDMAKLELEKKYDDEIKTYDACYNHMMIFSDMLTSALVATCEGQTGGYYRKYMKYKSKYVTSKN